MKKAVILLVAALAVGLSFGAKPRGKKPMPIPKNSWVIDVSPKSPLKTLEDALERVAKIRKKKAKVPIVVRLAPGDYYLEKQPVWITGKHSSTNEAPLIICSADLVNKACIKAGAPLQKWKKVEFNGRKDVWCAEIPEKFNMPQEPRSVHLFYNGKWMQPARWPNVEPTSPYATGYAFAELNQVEGKGFFQNEVRVRPKDVRKWARPEDGWVTAFHTHNYGSQTLSVIGFAEGIIQLVGERKPLKGNNRFDRWAIFNMAEELDLPGEWYYDGRLRKAYIITPDGKEPKGATITLVHPKEMIRLNGAGNCMLIGLDISNGGTAIRISGDNNQVIACTIHDNCATGVYITGRNNRVTDCDIFRAGSHAVFIHSHWDDRLIHTRQNNVIENNYIHHCGVIGRGAAAIYNAAQGIKIRHNLIHDQPRAALCGYGRFCEISYNRVRHTNLMGDDTGAFYASGWTTGNQSHICYNWITDSIGYHRMGDSFYRHQYGACGIYLDECTGGAKVYGNLIESCNWAAMHLHNSRWNTISNNVFVSNGWKPDGVWTHQLSIQTWDKKGFANDTLHRGEFRSLVKHDVRWRKLPELSQDPDTDEVYSKDEWGTMIMGTQVKNNIFYYPNQSKGMNLFAVRLNMTTNFFNNNIYWPGESGQSRIRMVTKIGWVESDWGSWQGIKQDLNTIIADPMFRNPAKKDYRLKPGSPAFKVGFKEIPYKKIGLKKTRFRPELPEEAEGFREHPEWLKLKNDNAKKPAAKAKG